MAATQPHRAKAKESPWSVKRTQDAAALVERFGPDAVEWLDLFLADYVFAGEPLDQVMTEARRLGELPARPVRSWFNDD
ncbi:hypothetical protein LJR225_002983 [Phenylobacterium sp. LjRoot225]|uniref:hypothetical protein n=1 Tax=Phenylobacterium sp. LjRoot225 TaxID=3342285 RepID=UPI003ECF96FE